MGTNYYVRTNPCAACCRHDVVHIGKYSGGWAFLFSPEPGRTTFKGWLAFLRENAEGIYDEYDQRQTLTHLLELVESSKDERWCGTDPNRGRYLGVGVGRRLEDVEYLDPDGYRFAARRGFS